MTSAGAKRNPSKKRIKWTIIILLIFSAWTGFTVYNQWLDISVKEKKMADLKNEQAKVMENKNNLEEKVLLLNNNEYIAEIARKYYFLSKPGEIIFISPKE